MVDSIQQELTSFETDVLYEVNESGNTIELKAQSSDISTYDLQEWDLNLVIKSTYSEHANKDASLDFHLSLNDVCWDLTLLPPVSTQTEWVWTATETTELYFLPMDTVWGDYCSGFTYEVVYVDGSFAIDPPDLSSIFTVEYPADTQSGEHKVNVLARDLNWVGTHTFLIRGRNGGGSSKEYNTVDSATFTINWLDPCGDNELTLVATISDNTYHIDR